MRYKTRINNENDFKMNVKKNYVSLHKKILTSSILFTSNQVDATFVS